MAKDQPRCGMTEPDVRCTVCDAAIFWNGYRWDAVYLVTCGDVCPNVIQGIVTPDHTPPSVMAVTA